MPLACVSVGRYSRSIRGNALDRIQTLLGNFRLLEAAGACELIASGLAGGPAVRKPLSWWEALAASARSYRSAIYSTDSKGIEAIDDWSQLLVPDAELAELSDEKARLALEYRRWLRDVDGGRAYIAWLTAYVAVVELDGERALRSLEDCATIASEFVDAAKIMQWGSVYEFLQSTANSLMLFLPVAAHPVSDVRRFAFLPATLRTGYGSADALDIQSHRRAGDPRPHPA